MKHTSLSKIRALAAIAIFIPALLSAEIQNEEPSLPWWSGGMRIHHPNISAWDVHVMDFDEFVAEAVSIHANAIVLTAGGLVAFYPSEITGHYVSEKLEGRDFIGEVTPRAQAAGLKVIARVDFSALSDELYALHPDWAARDARGGRFPRQGRPDQIATCPNSPYRAEGFAIPVINEILTRYDVDGFHVNAGDWPGHCRCDYCQVSFHAATGERLPDSDEENPQLWKQYTQWRYQRVAQSFKALHDTAKSLKPDIFFMAETFLGSPSYDLPLMAEVCSTTLTTTGNVAHKRDPVFNFSGMVARYARVAKPDIQPLINQKAFIKSRAWVYSMVPPNEYRLFVWQSIANGAGLKTPFHGTLNQWDRRNISAISDAFALMEKYPEVYVQARPVAPVALVWPQRTITHWQGPPKGDLAEAGWVIPKSNVTMGRAGSTGKDIARASVFRAFRGTFSVRCFA